MSSPPYPHSLLSSQCQPHPGEGGAEPPSQPAPRVTKGPSPHPSAPPPPVPSWQWPPSDMVPGTVTRMTHGCSEASSPLSREGSGVARVSQLWRESPEEHYYNTASWRSPPTALHSEVEAQRLCAATRRKHPEGEGGSVGSARLELQSRPCHSSPGWGARLL